LEKDGRQTVSLGKLWQRNLTAGVKRVLKPARDSGRTIPMGNLDKEGKETKEGPLRGGGGTTRKEKTTLRTCGEGGRDMITREAKSYGRGADDIGSETLQQRLTDKACGAST